MSFDTWGQSSVTLRTVIRSAAELVHPKSHAGTYPVLAYFPQLKVLAHQLLKAEEVGESPAVLQDLALQLLEVMRAANAAKPTPDKFVRPASEVVRQPQQIRARDQELRDLRKKALTTTAKPAPMTALFDLPMTPEKPARTVTRKPVSTATAELAFFERTI